MSKSTTRTPLRSSRVWARYVGTPEHRAVPGVPARDLSAEEVERYGGEAVLANAQCWEFVPVEEKGAQGAEGDDDGS